MKHLEPATHRMAFRPASAGPGGTGGTAESRARPGPPESESAADMLPRASHAPRCPRHATRGLWPANTKGGIMSVCVLERFRFLTVTPRRCISYKLFQ